MHANNFGALITLMHVATELHLSKYPCSGVEENASSDTNVLVEDCRELSYYMMYLLVTHPSLLPLDHSEINTLEECQEELRASEEEGEDVRGQFTNLFDPHACMETLKEIKEMWLLLIIYAASKSRPEIHAAQQAKGGELLTFVYLLLAHHGFRSSSGYSRIELHNFRFGHSIFYALRPSDGELMDTPA
uniref:Uncharacterized protein n=1 Tax=Arundo donax TaxID=35708 RepID=A0A0A9BJP0_ARUDO